MTHANILEDAIQYRDDLRDLLAFKKALEEWDGYVECSFGAYKCVLTMKVSKADFLRSLETQERMLRNTLEMWGIDLTPYAIQTDGEQP